MWELPIHCRHCNPEGSGWRKMRRKAQGMDSRKLRGLARVWVKGLGFRVKLMILYLKGFILKRDSQRHALHLSNTKDRKRILFLET